MNMLPHKKARRFAGRLAFYVVLIAIMLITIFPFLYMVLGSFKSTVDIVNPSRTFVFTPTLKNFVTVFTEYNLALPLKNSIIISTAATLISLILALPAAYAIAKYRLTALQIIILGIRTIPTVAFLVPLYLLFSKVHMVGTYASIILAHMLVTMPFIVWVMIPYFKSVPREIEESALIDGASQFGVFMRMMLPLSIPGIMTVTIMSFITSWNNFMFGLILGNAQTKVLPTLIFNFMSHTEINWAGLMAAAFIVTLPIIVISVFLQKYIVQGLTAGAVKG